MRKPSSTSDWANALTFALEILALGALAGTSEIAPAVFGAVILIAALSRALPSGASPRAHTALWAALIVGTALMWKQFSVHPLIAVAHGAPIGHALLWLSRDKSRSRGSRLAIGLVELVLASSLTTEAYLPIVIIAFIVLSSVALSCSFLERSPELARNPLPANFISRGIGSAALIFLSSILIFPILPRMEEGLQLSPQTRGAVTGYTEGVNISQWRNAPEQGAGRPIVRIFAPDGVDLGLEFYLGLLRGRVLDSFDGKQWSPRSRKFENSRAPASSSAAPGAIRVEASREPIHTDSLPIPYGTRAAWIQRGDSEVPARKLSSGEWVDSLSQERRSNYAFDLVSNDLTYLREAQDTPEAIHTHVPAELSNDRMRKLAAQIFSNAGSPQEKVQRLQSYFRNEGFGASQPGSQDEFEAALAARTTRLSPLEEFLFIRKKGHCEWFSSATAVLLRLGGVPTRLVAGFRLSRSQTAGMLTFRDSDAHAWVEAHVPGRGWIPLDTTPRLQREGGVLEDLGSVYEWATAYWERYVLTFTQQSFLKRSFTWKSELGAGALNLLHAYRDQFLIFTGAALGAIALLAGVIWVWFPWIFSIRWRVQEGPWKLKRERVRMEKLLRAKTGEADIEKAALSVFRRHGTRAGHAFEAWRSSYHRARFGADSESLPKASHEIQKEIRERFREFSKFVALFLLCLAPAHASALVSNSFALSSPPSWLKLARAEKVAARVERALEWDLQESGCTFIPMKFRSPRDMVTDRLK